MTIKDLTAARERRLREYLARDRAQKRDLYGGDLVEAINGGMGTCLKLSDFSGEINESELQWPPDLNDAPGLVAAYEDKSVVAEILSRIDVVLGVVSGQIYYHGKDFMGAAAVDGVLLSGLLGASVRSGDSVVMSLDSLGGVVLVDCYSVGFDSRLSIVVQGERLIEVVRSCFSRS